VLDTHCTFAGKHATRGHRVASASVTSLFHTRVVHFWPYWSPLVSKSSECGQDLAPPKVYSRGEQCPDAHMARACARMRTGSSGAMRRPTVCHQGGAAMHKRLVRSLALVLITLGWGNKSLGDQVPAPRGELRIVDKNPSNWVSLTFSIFEHLMETDVGGKVV